MKVDHIAELYVKSLHCLIKNMAFVSSFLLITVILIPVIVSIEMLNPNMGYAAELRLNSTSHSNNTASGHSNNTASTNMSAKSSKSLNQGTRFTQCDANKFKITYVPSIWNESELYQHCSMFTLAADKTFPSSTYFRTCSAGDLTPINSSIYEVAHNVLFFKSSDVNLMNGPFYYGIRHGIIAELYFKIGSKALDQASQPILPFVNQSCAVPTFQQIFPQGGSPSDLSNLTTSPSKSNGAPISSSSGGSSSTPPKSNVSGSDKQTNITGSSTAAFYIMSFDHKKVYVVEYTAPQNIFETYLPVVRQMVSSFDFS